MNLRKINNEVFIAEDPIVRIGSNEIEFLKQRARESTRKRARICAHKSNEDALHEMLIAIFACSYIRPHRHLGKSESFHIVEGEVDVAIFDDGGALSQVIQLGAPGLGRDFFYRLAESAFHTLIIRSDFLVVHEVTNGPFDPEHTLLAPFAPGEDRPVEARAYMERISKEVARYLEGKKG
jgi:cupin fold WbuC family metalloprotein